MATPFRRILVAEAPHREGDAGPAKRVPAVFGVLPWSQGQSWLGVFVTAAFAFEPVPARDDGRPAMQPRDPSPPRAGPPDEASPRPDDFVPLRERVDVALVGGPDFVPLPSGRVDARKMSLALAGRSIAFLAEPPHPGKFALKPPVTRHLGDARPFDPRPRAGHDGAAAGFRHDEDFDMSAYQSAPPELQFEVPPEALPAVELEGVLAPGDRLVLAPPLEPRLLLEYAESGGEIIPVPLFLDRLLIDVDQSLLEVCWRGHAEVVPPADRDVDRLIVAWAAPAEWRRDDAAPWRRALRDLPRGTFGNAWERDDAVRGEAPPPLDEHELAMARHESWDFPEAPEPEMELERYATISAELAEQREPRADVLARNGVDDYAWSVEERAWAQKVATADDDPETEALRLRYGDALRDARARLGTDRERELSAAQWVELAARAQRGDPTRELGRVGLGLGAYLRLDESWKARAAADPALAEELDQLRAEIDARLEKEPLENPFDDEDDEEDAS